MQPFHITSAGIEVLRAGQQIGLINARSLALSTGTINAHNNELRQFEITDGSIVIDSPMLEYKLYLGGQPLQTPARVF